ncbi:ornithine cyclodeaminase [Serratia ureilytica]|uniref:ornithine cyclodeaminase n=1 Tax=Serratia ureilytica TaxID=300181 RepID=UPI0011C7EF7A|nr:ornithine cyclodeaminase [Serratia ureilytica]TXE51899.1 ornithine cyclodeaminase [Serratia ureilytica]
MKYKFDVSNNLVHVDPASTNQYPLAALICEPPYGTPLDPLIVGNLVRKALFDLSKGICYGTKAVLQPQDSEIFPLIGIESLNERFARERLNWKLNALISANKKYGAVKIVGSNAYNRTKGLARSRSLLVLYDKLTMQPISIMDGTDISNMRTASYASIVAEFAFRECNNFSVFLLGAGCVAEKVIDDLDAHYGDRVSIVYVKSRSIEGAVEFAHNATRRVRFAIQPVNDFDTLKFSDFVITASNARSPVFNDAFLRDDAVILHLGGDETPTDFIARVLKTGTILCDDVEMVCHRGSQSLALFFSRQGRSLSMEAEQYKIHNLWHGLQEKKSKTGPVFITCVGLPVLDLYVAEWVYEESRKFNSQGFPDEA